MTSRGFIAACGLAVGCSPTVETNDGSTGTGGDASSSSGGRDATGGTTGAPFEVCEPQLVDGSDPIDEDDCDTFFEPFLPKIPPPLQVRIVNARDDTITVRQMSRAWIRLQGTAGGRALELHDPCRSDTPPWLCDCEDDNACLLCTPIWIPPATQWVEPGDAVVKQWDRAVVTDVVLPGECRAAEDAADFECTTLMYAPLGTYEVSAEAYDGTCTSADDGCPSLTATAPWDGQCETIELVFE